MAQDKSNKSCVFIIGIVLCLILAGVLIYLCIYLTEYTPKESTTTLTSSTNQTKIVLSDSKNMIKTMNIALHDTANNNDDTVPVHVSIPTLKKTAVVSFTRIAVPTRAIKKVTYVPETITLQNIN